MGSIPAEGTMNIKLSEHTTFRMGGQATLYSLESKADVEEFFSIPESDKYFVLGGGSNVLFDEGIFLTPFISLTEKIHFIEREVGDNVFVRATAGLFWDVFVSEMVALDLSGLELLSYIPGTVGAAPVQNVGAYGAEVKDTLVEVTVYDTKRKEWRVFSNTECELCYRQSIFQDHKEYIIYDTLWCLKRGGVVQVTYPSLIAYMNEHRMSGTISEIRDAVIAVRRSKLPEISNIPSVGSFFKNPIVSNEEVRRFQEKFQEKFPDMPVFSFSNKEKKLAAGWLIEHAECGNINDTVFSLYKDNKLVITHDGDATLPLLLLYVKKITERVKEEFDVTLVVEPEIFKER